MKTMTSTDQNMATVYSPIQYVERGHTVTEHNYDLPKGQHSNLVGSFSYRQPSMKAGQLKAKIAVQKRKLAALETREKAMASFEPKKKKILKCKIKYLENQLNHEMATQPEVRVNVREKDNK